MQIQKHYRRRVFFRTICLGSVALLASFGCHKEAPEVAKESAPVVAKEDHAIELTVEQVAKLGIEVVAAKSILRAPEVVGYGIVLSRDVIAQAVAEVRIAAAATNQSRASVARAQRLAGTPGAFGADAEETAKRQALVDAAALALAQRKLSVTLGDSSAWRNNDGEKILDELANGRAKLARVTFPLGALRGAAPRSLRFAPLDANATQNWNSVRIWDAAADATVPGRSFFALLKENTLPEGERLQVWAPSGAPVSGVLIPESAVILHDGEYWCYVAVEPEKFVRKPIDTDRPVAGGYFVTESVSIDAAIVAKSAGLLLARETNNSTEAD